MEDITHRTVVQDHDLAEVWLDVTQVFDIGTIAECAMLSIVSPAKVLAFTLEPIDDWISILLD